MKHVRSPIAGKRPLASGLNLWHHCGNHLIGYLRYFVIAFLLHPTPAGAALRQPATTATHRSGMYWKPRGTGYVGGWYAELLRQFRAAARWTFRMLGAPDQKLEVHLAIVTGIFIDGHGRCSVSRDRNTLPILCCTRSFSKEQEERLQCPRSVSQRPT